MFTLKNIDQMGRRDLITEQARAKNYYKTMYRYQGMVIAYGAQIKAILEEIEPEGNMAATVEEWRALADKGRTTVRKTQNDLNRVDAYLRMIEARLSDGSKWYTAHEIAEMADGVLDHDHHSIFYETPGL